MKYLLTIFLFLSINVFSMDTYVVCKERKMPKLTVCVNDYLDKGYKPFSHLRAVAVNVGPAVGIHYFQALIKE